MVAQPSVEVTEAADAAICVAVIALLAAAEAGYSAILFVAVGAGTEPIWIVHPVHARVAQQTDHAFRTGVGGLAQEALCWTGRTGCFILSSPGTPD